MQPSSSNVEIFNRISLELFAELYEAFPVPIAITPDALALSEVPDEATYGATWSVMEIAGETVTFLQEEGFLKYRDRVITREFGDVRLTLKGLAILGILVSLVATEPREPLIRKIKRMAAKGGEKACNGSGGSRSFPGFQIRTECS